VAARIDRRLASLSTVLRNGQTVEIIPAPGGKPNPAWLAFVVSGKARASIRAYLKNLKQIEAEALGRRLINAELAAFGVDLGQVDPIRIAAYLEDASLVSQEALLADIGLGNRLPALVARRLAAAEGEELPAHEPGPDDAHLHPHRLAIRGTEGMVVNFARCCRPIPGDGIAGLFSPGRGIVVHRNDCRNLGSLETKRDKRLDIEWAADPDGEFSVEIRVEIGNRRGALAVVAGAIAEQGSNIENVHSREKDGITSALDLIVTVTGRQHLARIMRRLRQIPLVLRIVRVGR
jgi:(p)ppGpp synthase/HD superfamily hydrolase